MQGRTLGVLIGVATWIMLWLVLLFLNQPMAPYGYAPWWDTLKPEARAKMAQTAQENFVRKDIPGYAVLAAIPAFIIYAMVRDKQSRYGTRLSNFGPKARAVLRLYMYYVGLNEHIQGFALGSEVISETSALPMLFICTDIHVYFFSANEDGSPAEPLLRHLIPRDNRIQLTVNRPAEFEIGWTDPSTNEPNLIVFRQPDGALRAPRTAGYVESVLRAMAVG